ncbi:MAG: ABC transporter ATP-binding protein [Gammaproteobacteria bacterium]|nr:ABC transporter ATP-binding protein [Gammaproteobacteria bacterium]
MSDESYDPKELFRIKTVRELVAMIPRVFKVSWQVSPPLIIFLGSITIVTALVPAATIYITKVIVDLVFDSQSMEMQWGIVVVPLAVIFALWIGSSLVREISWVAEDQLSERTFNSANEMLLRKTSKLDLAFFEAPKFFDQLSQARQQQYSLQRLPKEIFGFFEMVISMSAMFGLVSLLHPFASVILVVSVIPRFFLQRHLTRNFYWIDSSLIRNRRLSGYMEGILTGQGTAKEVRVFGLGDLFIDKFLNFRSKYIDAYKKQHLQFIKYNVSLDVLTTLGVGAVSVYAVLEAVRGEISLGTLIAVFSAAQQIVSLVGGLVYRLNSVYRFSLQTSRLFELLDLDPKSIDGSLEPPRQRPVFLEPNGIGRGISVRGVSFRYPYTEKEVLRDVTFSVPVGSKVAIVGENGAGKTTLVKLLTRFYDPIAGSIQLDGRDYRDYDLESLRSSIGVVFQDFNHYSLTAGENIGVGSVRNIEDRPKVEQAAIQSGANVVIDKLPQGYDTMLGRTLDEGIDLSGGEWQQISIARAYMSDASILILDEPTSALDSLREQELYQKISRLSSNKTVIFISHRFSTVRMADIVVVIKDGKSVEVGSHTELMSNKNTYYTMFQTQARKYQ